MHTAAPADPDGATRAGIGRPWKVKVALVGADTRGKANLIRESALDPFDERYRRSIGVNVLKKVLVLTNGDRIHLDVIVYDVLGVEAMREPLCHRFLLGTKGIVAVCEGATRESVQALDRWIRAVRRVAGEVPAVVLVDAEPGGEPEPTGAPAPAPGEPVAGWFLASREGRRALETALESLGRQILHASLGTPG